MRFELAPPSEQKGLIRRLPGLSYVVKEALAALRKARERRETAHQRAFQGSPGSWASAVGDIAWAESPLSRASQIRIPLLIAQGANDPRVKQAESEQIIAALKQAGIEYDYMLFSDEGHGFAKPENRLKFYTAADKFLARYLGGRSE